jgi:hypothetical protein
LRLPATRTYSLSRRVSRAAGHENWHIDSVGVRLRDKFGLRKAKRESLPDKVGDIEGGRVSDALESYAERTAAASVRRRRNRRFEALRARGGTLADANEREQSGEAPNHSPAMSRGDFENHFGGHQAMRRREGGDSNAAASRFVRTVAAAQSPVTLSSCSLMGVITLGAAIESGNGFVSPKMRRALNIYAWQYIYTYCICYYLI